MNITKARQLTGYEKVDYEEYCDGGTCDYCNTNYTRYNAQNELRTSYEYEEYNYACNKCVKWMAEGVEEMERTGEYIVIVGLF